jgi:FO synthase
LEPHVGTLIDHYVAPDRVQAQWARLEALSMPELLAQAWQLARNGHGEIVTYSPKVFIPLTRLCRDVCAYCTFARTPNSHDPDYLDRDAVLEIARLGAAAGCSEALFTLGDKPELRYSSARESLARLGHGTTVSYLRAVCEAVVTETGLLPHVNAGVLSRAEMLELRAVSASQGLMLESAAERLALRGGPHFGSPDKDPALRVRMIEEAGALAIPFTTGILIGIGESRRERIESLMLLAELHRRHGHIQEIIIQNFRAKPDTRMRDSEEPRLEELLWSTAAARLIFGSEMNIQVPPNLSYDSFPRLLDAGLNDWGGISPVTPDHVNPEAPWPDIPRLRDATEAARLTLAPRLPVYPAYVADCARWQDPTMAVHVIRSADSDGFARDHAFVVGRGVAPADPFCPPGVARFAPRLDALLRRAMDGERLCERDLTTLLSARGSAVAEICAAADELRQSVNGDLVRYVVNRNINYTNMCSYRCGFCAFSKGKTAEHLRGKPYVLGLDEVARRSAEAWQRGATEVCMQGGIHPDYTGRTYLDLVRVVKDAVPGMHVHAFSPLEILQGASTLGLPFEAYLGRLRDAGLGSLPGTAAEILDDAVRAHLCPDKLKTDEWLTIVAAAHRVGLRTTATIMFGHIERPVSLARHILLIRDLQERTGGFTEFVPLPFVHMEAPIFLKGKARKGPTWREVVLMHAVVRLALHPLIPNVQVSWVKLGREGAGRLLNAGANDLGGTLMNESISRAAGNQHGQEMPPEVMEALISDAGRIPQQRTTLYGSVASERRRASFGARPLAPITREPSRVSEPSCRDAATA